MRSKLTRKRCLSAVFLLVGCFAACGEWHSIDIDSVDTETPTDTDPAQDTVSSDSDTFGEIQQGLVINTKDGPVQGFSEDTTRIFLSIPYAAAPTGSLRWKAPAPASPWTEPFDATEPAPLCPQYALPMFNPSGVEDCLKLNIWTPDPAPDQPLPVMVWLHGGAFLYGGGSEPYYDGKTLSAGQNVVIVTLSYRLGALGFMAHKALTAEDPTYPGSGNYGMMDQLAALKWVRENIVAFGGDPTNVTLFGESAGAMSTGLHLFASASSGLFHRAIMQSGPFSLVSLAPLNVAEEKGDMLAEAVGCNNPSDVLNCLRNKDAFEIQGAFLSVKELPGGLFFQSENSLKLWFPIVDGVFLKHTLEDSLSMGLVADVPVIMGTNTDEGALFLSDIIAAIALTSANDYDEVLERRFPGHSETIKTRYPLNDYATPNEALARIIGDAFFVCSTRQTARSLFKRGLDVYLYAFNRVPSISYFPDFGVFHTAEIMFIFGNSGQLGAMDGDDVILGSAMSTYWTTFAAAGNPNSSASALTWPTFDESSEEHIIFDLPLSLGSWHKKDVCDFWDTIL